jgi:GWxTD domain-containing protein
MGRFTSFHRAGRVLAGTLISAAPAAAQKIDIAVFRMKQEAATLVLGTLEVQRPIGGAAPCQYQLEMRVTDARRTPLLNEQWKEERGCPAASTQTIVTYEAVRFAAVPGRYEVAVGLNPAGKPDEVKRKSIAVETLPANARASDLIVANEIGVVDSANSARWTIKHDGIGIRTGAETRIASDAPKLAFYLEVYPRGVEAITGKAVGIVRDADNKELARLDLAAINGKAPRARLAGSIPVAGLAPGAYTLEANVQLADTTLSRTATFVMEAPVVVVAERPSTESNYFNSLSPEQLKSLFDPLVVWLQTKQQRDLYMRLDETGRRQFLIKYFGPDGPNGSKENRLDVFLERVRQVNEKYKERTGSRTEGWQTDRGRIYLLRGEPQNQLKRPFAPNDAPPYEIWVFNLGQQYVYLFSDDSRFGHYRLVFSTDPLEISLSDWQDRIGQAALDDLKQFGVKTGGDASERILPHL